jgi:hypothetical protein
MALLFMDGFDAGDFATKWIPTSGASSTTTRFGVGRSLLLQNSNHHIEYSFTAASEVFFGTAIMYGSSTLRDPLNTDSKVVAFHGDNGTLQHVSVATNSFGQWVAYRGATQIGISVPQLVTSVWNYLEVRVLISDTVGRCVVKLNGNTMIDFTGDTKNGGTNTSVDKMKLAGISNFSTDQYYDDLYLCDASGSAPYNTYLGDVRIHTIVPNAAGSSTQLTPSSGANYTTVDELPYSATDYVYGTSGQTDLYAASDLPGGTGIIYGVQTNAVVKKTDAGNISGRTAIKSGASTYYGTSVGLNTTDISVIRVDQVNPATSSTWTSGEVNGIEIGVGAV